MAITNPSGVAGGHVVVAVRHQPEQDPLELVAAGLQVGDVGGELGGGRGVADQRRRRPATSASRFSVDRASWRANEPRADVPVVASIRSPQNCRPASSTVRSRNAS